MQRVSVFDTTLRDGEQSPGATMTVNEKVRLAGQLEALGVDVVEAGFPAASPRESEAVRSVAELLADPTVAALARAKDTDIERAARALEPAVRPRIHTFLATSPLHRERKLGISKAECLARVASAVAKARTYTDDVEFSAEDATRTERDFLCKVIEVAVQAGATVVNLPDTVGTAHPGDVAGMFDAVRATVPGIESVVLSTHCHDDLGLAVANSLAAIEHGARQVECTLNGIGERAGNAALEEVVMALQVLPRFEDYDVGINTERLCPTSELLCAITGIRTPPNKAIVGANAFAHEAGIHQDGVLKDPRTYEIMQPETVGARAHRMVLGKHSGRHALKARYEELGFALEGEELDRAYKLFVLLAETKKVVHDEDLLAIYYQGTMADAARAFRLEHLEVRCGRHPARATARVSHNGGPAIEAEGTGDGPIDATFAALGAISPWGHRLEEFSIQAASPGKDAVGNVHLLLRVAGHPFHGRASSTDIVEAAARAFLNALDKAEHATLLEEKAFAEAQYWAV